MKWVSIFLCTLFCALPWMAGGRVGATEPSPELNKILRDWEYRRLQTRSMSYSLKGRGVIPRGTHTGDPDLPPEFKGREVPSADHSFPLAINLSVDFVNNLARCEVKRESFYINKGSFIPDHEISLYDGKRLKRHTPRESNTNDQHPPSKAQPDLWEDVGSNHFFPQDVFPLFFVHGRIPSGGGPDPTKLNDSLDPSLFRMAGYGEYAGRKCTILRATIHERSNTVDEFWIDETRRSAILRWVRMVKGRTLFNSNVGYPETGSALWPESCDWTWYNMRRGAVLNSFSLKVTDFKLNPDLDPADFRAEPTPGTVVANKEGVFKVQDDGSLTRFLFNHEQPPPSSWWSSRWVILVIVVGVAALGVFLWRRHSLRAKA
jgi:hypothetical protein